MFWRDLFTAASIKGMHHSIFRFSGQAQTVGNNIQPTALFTFILGIYFISQINPWLCLLIFPLALISSVIIKRLSEQSFDNLGKQRQQSTELWKTFEEGILGFLPLRFHQDIDHYFKKIEKKGFALKQVLQKQAHLESTSYFWTSTLFMLTIGCIMIVSSIFVVNNKITIGGLTAIMMYNNLLSEPLIKLQEIIKKIQKLNVSLLRIEKIYAMETGITESSTRAIDEIYLRDVGYKIDGKTILKGVNLDIKSGTSIMIEGETGAGKSTLANIITGIYPCTSGEMYYLSGGETTDHPPKVSYMLQDEYLFDDTVYNNVLVGKRNAEPEEVENVLQICNLEKVVREHPGCIGINGKNLSGGERKRILLARTLLDDISDIYVFDEMSASLDQTMYMELWKRIDTYLKDKIRIYIEHNTVMEKDVNYIIRISNRGIDKEINC